MKLVLGGQIRQVHTRAKKINVQLLKAEYGRRLVGEIFSVSEGHMRLKLHPEGIAAYVQEGQPTKLPILTAADANDIRKENQLLAKAAAAAAATKSTESVAQQASELERKELQSSTNTNAKLRNLLDSLDFPMSNSASQPIKNETAQDTSSIDNNTSNLRSSAGLASSPKSKKFDWQNDIITNIVNK